MAKIEDKLIRILRNKPTVITRAFFWKIPHNSGREDVRLKIGRYKKPKEMFEDAQPETLVVDFYNNLPNRI